MKAVIRAVDRINQFIGLSVEHLYLICVLITIYEVCMRYFFNSPTQWAFEVVMVVCGSAWALSGGYISMRKAHIAITILHERAKGRVRAALLGLVISLPGTIGFIITGWNDARVPPGNFGYVSLIGFALIAPATVLCAPIGARIAHSFSAKRLSMSFGVFLVIVAVRLFYRAFA